MQSDISVLLVKMGVCLMFLMAILPSVVLSSTGIAPARNLFVLILTPDAAGHFTLLLAIGEGLMERGHNSE